MSTGTNWLRARARKNMLKKYLNWFQSTTGKKVRRLYFVLLSLLLGKFAGDVVPLRSITLSSSDIRHPIALPQAYQHPSDAYGTKVLASLGIRGSLRSAWVWSVRN